MLVISLLLFLIAALLGFYLLSYVLKNKNTPKAIAFIHGPVGATGLVLLILYAILNNPKPYLSIILFVITACGGFLLIYRDLTGKTLPSWMALGHGTLGIISVVTLIYFLIQI